MDAAGSGFGLGVQRDEVKGRAVGANTATVTRNGIMTANGRSLPPCRPTGIPRIDPGPLSPLAGLEDVYGPEQVH
jgi:hypothetical protein